MDNKIIHEGNVTLNVPKFDKVSAKAPVFYNPAMELNRDLSVAALTVFRSGLNHDIYVCDAFGGTGIRGIRYAKEIKGIEKAIVNDLNPLAVELTRENIDLNQLENVIVCKEDANMILRKCKGKFDVIDIDPFGKWIITGGVSSIQMWDLNTGQEVYRISRDGFSSVAFSWDGRWVVSASNNIQILNAGTGKQVRQIPIDSTSGDIRTIVFNPDGKLLAGANGNTIRVWETATGDEITGAP